MKKLVLLCFLIVFSNSFYAQSNKAKKEPTTQETSKKKSSYDYNKDVPVKSNNKDTKSKSTYDYDKKTNKSEANKVDAKIKDEKYTHGNSKKQPTYKETNEKAPKTPDKVTGTYNGKKVYTGSRGGKYYINKNGNKTYIQD